MSRYFGYDRKSSGSAHEHPGRVDWLLSQAKDSGIELVGHLVHIGRKRNEASRFVELRAEMEKVGATVIFTPFLDRLAPTGWGDWPKKHPLIRNIPVYVPNRKEDFPEWKRERERRLQKIMKRAVALMDEEDFAYAVALRSRYLRIVDQFEDHDV